jgi:hypothetical protein
MPRRRGVDGVLWRLNRLEPTPGGPARHAPELEHLSVGLHR